MAVLCNSWSSVCFQILNFYCGQRWSTTGTGHQHLQPNCCGIAEATEGEVAEEKVHGGVQLGIHPNQGDHSQICQKIDEINKEKHCK